MEWSKEDCVIDDFTVSENMCGAMQLLLFFFHLFELELFDVKALWQRGAFSPHKTLKRAKKLTINKYHFLKEKNNWY